MADDQPRELGQITGYADLHRLMRERAAELNISRSDIDRLAGLASGHAGKLLAPRPIRRLGDDTLGFVLPALGMKLVAMEDLQAVERIRATTEPRDGSKDHSHNRVVILEFSRRHFQRMGRIGGANSRKYMTPAQASALGRRAAAARRQASRRRAQSSPYTSPCAGA
jgi:hypothetical protein